MMQGPDNLVDLYVEAARAQPGFKMMMEHLKRMYHERTKGKELKLSVCAKLKKVTRILEKLIMRRSVKGVKDIVRAMATLDDMDNIAIVAELMLELHNKKMIKLLRIKERFFEQPSSGGWRGNTMCDCFHGHTHQRTHGHTHAHKHTHEHMDAWTHGHTHAWTHTKGHMDMHIDTQTHGHTWTYIKGHMDTHKSTHRHMKSHTYTHTHMDSHKRTHGHTQTQTQT